MIRCSGARLGPSYTPNSRNSSDFTGASQCASMGTNTSTYRQTFCSIG
jgi:hypothetical protein